MIILAHRGWWQQPAEKNSKTAFDRAFKAGYGVETDLRDGLGTVYISHDLPTTASQTFDNFLVQRSVHNNHAPLALNIKADGLQRQVAAACAGLSADDYFVFDMSVPDTLGYLKAGIPTFLRESELESPDRFMREQQGIRGIWLDCFKRDWITADLIKAYLGSGLDVALVSPELHHAERPYEAAWTEWKKAPYKTGKARLMLCTDFPDKAAQFF